MDNFDPYKVLLAIATNIPQRLMTDFVLQGHICNIMSTCNSDFYFTFTFTFMHLADAFIQSYTFFYQYVCSLGIEPTTFCAANAMLYHWATGTLLALIIKSDWLINK